MRTNTFILAMLLGVGVAPDFAVGPEVSQADSRVSVIFVDPQTFTDLRNEDGGPVSLSLLDQLKQFMRQTGERCVPAGMHLEIRVTDIDLAGEFEPGRGPEFGHIRIVKDLYLPRIKLEFRLTDAQGKVVSAGERELTDPAFQTRDAFARPGNDYLRYEKDLLRDWFRHEFKSVNLAGP